MAKKQLQGKKAGWKTREEELEGETHKKYFVWWFDVHEKDVKAFEKRLATAKREEDIQAYLAKHPMMLIHHLRGGHGRWVIPKKRLGAEYVTDFIIGEKNSGGYEWQAVELESPRARMFNKSGDPSAKLTHGIRQIQDWRAWLKRNQNYAAREVGKSGLGLPDISPNLSGLVLIGRREENDAVLDRRRQMSEELNIEFHSYDFLGDNARHQAAFFQSVRDRYNP